MVSKLAAEKFSRKISFEILEKLMPFAIFDEIPIRCWEFFNTTFSENHRHSAGLKFPNLCFGNGIGINACSVIRQDGIEKILRIASFGSVSHRTGKGSVTQFTFQRVLGQPMSLFSVFIPKVPKKITNPDLLDEFCFTLHNLFEYMVARE